MADFPPEMEDLRQALLSGEDIEKVLIEIATEYGITPTALRNRSVRALSGPLETHADRHKVRLMAVAMEHQRTKERRIQEHKTFYEYLGALTKITESDAPEAEQKAAIQRLDERYPDQAAELNAMFMGLWK